MEKSLQIAGRVYAGANGQSRLPLLDREGHLSISRAAAVRGEGQEREGVVAGRQGVSVRVPAGQAERVATRQQVPHADEQPEGASGRARQHHVETADRMNLGSVLSTGEPPRTE